jgi:hypothetical protein
VKGRRRGRPGHGLLAIPDRDYLVNERAKAELDELNNLMRAQLARSQEILNRLQPGPAASG